MSSIHPQPSLTSTIESMYVIAHRGQLNGPSSDQANCPNHLSKVIELYTDLLLEIDLWIDSNGYTLGHDYPQYPVTYSFLEHISPRAIFHIKNIQTCNHEAISFLSQITSSFHFFSHEDDAFTLTSHGWIWSHPKNGITSNTIAVMPEHSLAVAEIHKLPLICPDLVGVCTDYPLQLI